MVHFGEFLKTWSLRSNSVTRQVTFKKTKIGGNCQNSNATFWAIFKQSDWIIGQKMRLFRLIFKHSVKVICHTYETFIWLVSEVISEYWSNWSPQSSTGVLLRSLHGQTRKVAPGHPRSKLSCQEKPISISLLLIKILDVWLTNGLSLDFEGLEKE